MDTGQQVYNLEQTIAEVIRVAFSPDGSLLAVVTAGHPVRLWDIETAQYIRDFEMPDDTLGIFGVVFSPDGKQLAGGGVRNGTVTVWDVESGQTTGSFEHGDMSDVHDLAYSPDGSIVAAGGTGYAIRVWNVADGEAKHQLPLNNGIYGLAFSPDGTILASASSNRVAHLWNMETGIKLANLPHEDELMAVAFSPDGTLLAAGGYNFTISIWGVP